MTDYPDAAEWEGHWFNPVAFAEQWLAEEWAAKRPAELRRYLEGLERREKKSNDR